MTQKTKVSESKVKLVKELIELINNKKTILIASIKNLPASQLQEISKNLREKALIKVPKKNLIFRAIDNSKDEKIKNIKNYIKEDTAILFSELDSFDLAYELIKSKSPAKAKIGQEAPEDIKVESGPTELIPGPAISELGSLGIQIQIEKGKITIKEPRIIVKKGEKISENAANIMSKLDIKPFSVGLLPLVAFDTKEKKLYSEINIDTESIVNEMKVLFSKALAFAIEVRYFSEDTISFLISKARVNEMTLEKLLSKDNVKEETKNNKSADEKESEEKSNNNQTQEENSEEEK